MHRVPQSTAGGPRAGSALAKDAALGYHPADPSGGRASVETRELEQRISAVEEQNDRALMQAIARRDRQAFETLYYRYSPRLGRYLFKLLGRGESVDEAINDVMLVVWQSAARYDPNASAVSTWLFGIAHNKALKSLARTRRHAYEVPLEYEIANDNGETPDFDDAMEMADPDNPERVVMGRQVGEALTWALAQLSPEHRSVIELAFGEDFSYEQIAAVADCPVNTVKTRMFYARKRLAQLLAQRGLDPGGRQD